MILPRLLLLLSALMGPLIAQPSSPASAALSTPNPLIKQRADPYIYRHTDGYYYFMGTVPDYDRLELRRARSLQDLATAEPKTIWRKHATGAMGAHIWAPEIHYLEGKWYIYFAAGDAEKIWNIRMYVLENAAANPLDGEWIERGQLTTQWESFSLDATTFVNRGQRYLLWAQRDPAKKNNTDLYLAKMDSPLSIAGPPVEISTPEFDWEKVRYQVNEGPAILQRGGKIFLTYSAAGTGAEYCVGLLTADENADLLERKSWAKSPVPVFASSDGNRIFGPGHNSFTTAADGADVMVYHARSYRDIKGDPLKDPNRHTRIQPVTWRDDGTPEFGVPRHDDSFILSAAALTNERPIRVLIVDGYSNHNWRLTSALIRGILEPTGLFQVTVSTAPATKEAPGWNTWQPKFSDYDVVVQTCNDINGGPAWPRAVQKNFEAFVRNGGGVYVWHGGNNAFPDWPAYNDMIGLGWRKSDFGVALRITEDEQIVIIPPGKESGTSHGDRVDTIVRRLGDHPIHAALPRAWLTPDIEVYHHARGPAKNLTVISYGFDPDTKQNWPLEWVVGYGDGRVYTSTFGHVWKGDVQPERMRCAGLQTVVVRALQWLAQRDVSWPVPPDFPTEDKASVRGEIPVGATAAQ